MTKRFLMPLMLLMAFWASYVQAQCPYTVEVVQSAPLSCNGGPVTLTAVFNPAGTGYTVQWFANGAVINTISLSITQPGNYFAVVADSGSGCTSTVVHTAIVDSTLTTASIVGSGCENPVYTAVSNDPNSTYQWSNGATTAQITPTTVGTYCVTITGASGCTAQSCQVYNVGNPMSVSVVGWNNNICTDSLGVYAEIFGGVEPYSYEWSNGTSQGWLLPTSAGFYGVTVTDANGCTAAGSYYVEGDTDDCAKIEGTIFADYDNDCSLSAGDVGLQQMTIRVSDASGTEYFDYSVVGGHYEISLPAGAYFITPILLNTPWNTCPGIFQVSVAAGETAVYNLPLQASELCPLLEISVGNALLRRCNTQNYYYVSYNNQGTLVAEDAYAVLSLDDFLTAEQSSLPFTNLGNHQYRFELGDVTVNTSGYFWIRVGVSCDAVLGQTHCVEAIIYPNTPCPTANANWSGASVQLTAECDGTEVRFYAKNVGTAPMSGSLEYVIIEDAVMMKMAPQAPLLVGENRLVFASLANGATWRMEATQEPLHPGFSTPAVVVEGCGVAANGTVSLGFVTQLEADDADPWKDVVCRENIGSWDPNDKRGFPTGYGAKNHIRPGVELEYIIRFQNTGTDTAFAVVIRDTLSSWLDAATVRPGASSHPYRFDYYGDGYLKFVFDPIALPDSNVNLAASQGFVTFRVAQRADVPLETDILNTAAIYFDNNEPVITNTTRHRVGLNFMTVDTWSPGQSGTGVQLTIQPNPFKDFTDIQLEGTAVGTEWTGELIDAMGRLVLTKRSSDSTWRIDRGQLPAGSYMVRIMTQDGVIGKWTVIKG
jgi:uncharacterized repeat protein (TIGR01451 family)